MDRRKQLFQAGRACHLLAMRARSLLVAVVTALALVPGIAPAGEPIPGGLRPDQTPQFVSIGFDDNYLPQGLAWVLETFAPLRNPSGSGHSATYDRTPARVTFFCNTDNGQPVRPGNELGKLLAAAAAAGHEIGVHTRRHATSGDTASPVWEEEISGCRTDLAALSPASGAIIGFRAPFLQYNQATFLALRSLQFVYDSSIEHGFADTSDGTDLRWPYPLDHGSSDAPGIGAQAGLWEMPAYAFTVPPRLRARIQAKYKDFASANGKITGFDWNLVAGSTEGGAGFNREEFLETLKYSLDQRLRGNRAPLLIGGHSQFYAGQAYGIDFDPPHITFPQMQQVMVEFLAYALSKPEVRIVPFRSVLAWCRQPVPLAQGDGRTFNSGHD